MQNKCQAQRKSSGSQTEPETACNTTQHQQKVEKRDLENSFTHNLFCERGVANIMLTIWQATAKVIWLHPTKWTQDIS